MGRQPEERLRGAWSPLRRRSSWAAALLATASILSSCFLLTAGQPGTTYLRIQVLLQPPYPVEGQNATLIPNLGGRDPEEMFLCTWHRGLTIEEKKRILAYTFPPNPEQSNGPAFTGRETAVPGCSLHIRNLMTEDAGYYTVIVYGPGIYLQGHTSVVVSEILSSPVLRPSDVLVAENSRVALSCTTSNNPGVSVSWFKDGKPLLVVTGLSDWNRTLNLFRVTKNDAGLYTCEASNPVISTKSNSAKITMAYGPEEIKLNPEGTVKKRLNSDLKLECIADSVPAAQFQWYFNNTEILNETRSIFQVPFLNWTDEGNYTCQATNPFIHQRAMRTAYVTLTKEKLTSPVLWPSDVLVAKNSNVTLNCSTSNSIDVSVSWFKDGKSLLSGLSDRNRTLTLIHVTKNDAGLYTCEASKPGSCVKSNSTKITMAYGPEEIKLNPEGTVKKRLNSDLKLECIADSVPAAQFQWFFNNTEILNATKSIFQVRLNNWTDEGNYTCQATNPFTHQRAMRTAYVMLTKDPAALGAGTIAGIIIGSLAVTALIVGSLLYIFLRTCGRRDKPSTQTIASPSTYENVSHTGEAQVMIDSSADSSHKYQTLQHADQSVYQQLEGSRQVSQPSSPLS